jgi:Contractile injection system tube protein/LysM domain
MSPSLPINFLGRKFAEAQLEIVQPAEDKAVIPLHFNPAEYKLTKENAFAEIPIPGLESPPLQYVRGGAQVLTMDLLVDTSDELKDVRTEYVKKIEDQLYKKGKLHAPPILKFSWAAQEFTGVLVSLDITYTLFHIDGMPLRAKLAVKLKEYRTVDIQLKQTKTKSPDVEKRYVVRTGESLSSISDAVFRDPSLWRELARANGITDPRAVPPGTVLTVPRLIGARS